MADELQRIAQQYGGTNYGLGSGVNATPVVRANQNQTYYDPATNTHITQEAGTNKLSVVNPPRTTSSQNLIQKIGAVGSEVGHISAEVAGKAGGFIAHTAEDIAHHAVLAGGSLLNIPVDTARQAGLDYQIKQLDGKRTQLERDYTSGKVSKQDFTNRMRDISWQYTDFSKENQRFLQGPSPSERGKSVLELGADILPVGKLRFTAQLGKSAIRTVGKDGAEQVFANHATNLEKAVSTIPAIRDIFKRDILATAKRLPNQTPNQFLTDNAKQIAVGLLIKRPIIYQTNIGLADNAYHELLSGKYGAGAQSSAWLAVQAVSGGPLGWFFRNAKRAGTKLSTLANGKGSFIDELSKLHGSGSPAQIADYLHNLKADPSKLAGSEKTLRVMQEVNLQMADGDAARAAKSVMEHYQANGIDPAKLTTEQLVDDMTKWARADELTQKVSKELGYNTADGKLANLVAVRWDSKTKYALARDVANAGSNVQARLEVLQSYADRPGNGWSNNRILMTKLEQAIQAEDPARAIKAIQTASTLEKNISPKVAKELEKLGYSLAMPWNTRKTPSVAYEDTRKLLTAVTHGDTELFDQTVAPTPGISQFSNLLKKWGLTPEQNNAVAYEKLSENLVQELETVGVARDLGLTGPDKGAGGKAILSQLQAYINRHKPSYIGNKLVLGKSRQSALQDIRQMTVKEIMEALPGTSEVDAKALGKAVVDAYSKVPLEFRGLGIKAFDAAFKVPGFKYYNRVQSALRYTYNPFFRAQELIETKTLSHLKANNLVWMKPKSELDRVAKLMDESKIFTTGYTGEATQDLVVGRLHPNLLKTQRRDLAGLALDIAEKRGIRIEQMVQDHPDELADALKVIVQYPSKGALNSPLARTLNMAFFPMRYNLKVAALAAGEIAKLPPTVQTAVVHSLFNMSNWLNSPEGIQWKADNADALQLFSYFSVTGNMASVYNLLKNHHPNSIGELGLLGGLPFGFISQILDSEGLINLNTPYVDPKTGNILPEYIPQTTRARAATTLEGLINTMFTYPGRIIGLPGKASTLRKLTGAFINTNGSDYTKRLRTEDLTPLQQRTIDVLSNPNITQSEIDQLYTSPAPGEFNWYTIPPFVSDTPVHQLSHVDVLNIKAANKAAQAGKPAKTNILANGKHAALPIPGPNESL